MWRLYQREKQQTRRHGYASCEAILRGTYQVWQSIGAHFLRSMSDMVACDTTASRVGAAWSKTTGARTGGSSCVGASWTGRRTPPAWELFSRALHPITWDARATDGCPDLSRVEILWHRGPAVPALLVRHYVGNEDERSGHCSSRREGGGHGRRGSANLINDKERGRLRSKQDTDLAGGHWEKADADGGSALDTTPCGSVAIRRRYMASGRGCPCGVTQLGQITCCHASICGCQGEE